MRAYHDAEWGVPERDSRRLWRALMLDAFQAGLAWITILRKRDAFRTAFAGFDPSVAAKFGPRAGSIDDRSRYRPLSSKDPCCDRQRRGLTRHQRAGKDFSKFAWGMAGGKPIRSNGTGAGADALSVRVSDALKEGGFNSSAPSPPTPGCRRRASSTIARRGAFGS